MFKMTDPITDSTSKKWLLKKIPKKAYFYWGGEILPFLRYLTIVSFIKYNPDWEVELFYPYSLTKNQTWGSNEHNYNLICSDYFPWTNKLPIKLTPFDFIEIKIPNSYPEVFKSDFLRWHLLSTRGGLWSDMDILYFKPLNALSFNTEKNINIDTIVSTTENSNISSFFHSIGFLMSSSNNSYYRYISEVAHSQNLDFTNYQSVGSKILNKEFLSVDAIQDKFPILNIYNLPFNTLYSYYADITSPFKYISELFKPDGIDRITSHTIGIHWYAGHPSAENFINNMNHTNYQNYNTTPIGKLIELVMTT